MSGFAYASVCDGIGAVHVAWKPLGWRCAWTSEIDPFPSAVVEHHHELPNVGDMTAIDTEVVQDEYGAIDLLVGGTPCQSFSVAGLRRGLADPRGNLALVYLGLADRFRPCWLVWENVPGVLSSSGGRDFGAFLGALAELGYGFAYRVLDAQYVRVESHARAVPQRRRRVFVVGHLGDWRPAAEVLLERQGLCGHPPPRRESGEGVAGTLEARVAGGGFPGSDGAVSGHLQPFAFDPTQITNPHNESRPERHSACHALAAHAHTPAVADVVGTISPGAHAGSYNGQDAYTGMIQPVVNVLTHRMHKGLSAKCDEGQTPICVQTRGGAVHVGDQAATLGRNCGQASGGSPCVAYRTSGNCGVMEQGDVTGALNTATDPNQHIVRRGMAVRRLTPRECERLQGFPDDYTAITFRGKAAADTPRYRALGNSMAVNVMSWIGQRIKQSNRVGKLSE